MIVRVGTWNLEGGGRSRTVARAQQERLRHIVAEVMVYTEPPPSMSVPTAGRVSSPCERDIAGGSASWIAVCGAGVEPVGAPLPFSRMAAVGRVRTSAGSVIVYGSVLPWRSVARQAPEMVLPGEGYADAFVRMVAEQCADVRALLQQFPLDLVVWAGDFNQSLDGPNHGGSERGRAQLAGALGDLGFVAWNRASRHADVGMCAIDLVCGPCGRGVGSVEVIDPGGLSDHAGYIVEIGD